jgi:uncharacterized glyoxalase superfamily protein PhnB
MAAIEYTSLRPMLLTKDLRGTVDFYVSVFGFEVDEYNEKWGWSHVSRDGVSIMFAKPTEETAFAEPKFTGSFYINTEAVDELWELLKDRINVCYPLDNFNHGMREFGVFDNNGYIIQFGKPIDLEALAKEQQEGDGLL